MIALKNILVATDFGEAADSALNYGRELAARFGATLHVVHVAQNVYLSALGADNFATLAPGFHQDLVDAARRELDKRLARFEGVGTSAKGLVVTSSSPAFAIVDYAADHEIDLIVMGTHGRGALGHIVMGNVAERVVRLAPCPVLTVRHPQHEFVRPDVQAVVVPA